MLQCDIGLMHHPERDPAGHELSLDEFGPRGEPVPGREAEGERVVIGRDRVADLDFTLGPPQIGPDQFGRRLKQQINGLLVISLHSVPMDPVVEQARITLQSGRHFRQRRLDAAGIGLEHQPRLGQRLMALVDPAHLPAGAVGLEAPEHPVEPGDIILGPDRTTVFIEEVLLVARNERILDPHSAQQGLGVGIAPSGSKRVGQANAPFARLRLVILEPADDHRVGAFQRQRFLGLVAQHCLSGPFGVVADEIGDIGEACRAQSTRQLVPAIVFDQQRVARAQRQIMRGRAVALVKLGKQLLVDRLVCKRG